MKTSIHFFIILFVSSCASRGYKSLKQDIPSLFSKDFKEGRFIRKETPENILYIEKNLPQEEKDQEEFLEENYLVNDASKSYMFYTPKNRTPGQRFDSSLFENHPLIETTKDLNQKAILIN